MMARNIITNVTHQKSNVLLIYFIGFDSIRALESKNTKFECECIESGGGNSGVKRTSWAARKRYPSMSANGKQKQELDDPLEMLHELIR